MVFITRDLIISIGSSEKAGMQSFKEDGRIDIAPSKAHYLKVAGTVIFAVVSWNVHQSYL